MKTLKLKSFFTYFMLFKLHKLKCDNGHYTNAVVAEGETLEENLKNSLEIRSSLDMETEYVPEEIYDGEISSENDDEESGPETESSYELEDSNFDEEKYIIKPTCVCSV